MISQDYKRKWNILKKSGEIICVFLIIGKKDDHLKDIVQLIEL